MIKQCGVIVLACLLSVRPAVSEQPDDNLALPPCKKVHETRTPMAIWEPQVTANGELTSAPPRSRIVYIQFMVDDDLVHCLNAPDDKVYAFTYADPKKSGGAAGKINIRGQTQYTLFGFECYFSGFYINEAASANSHGTDTADFRPTDKFDVMSSGQYCRDGQVPRLGPYSRPHDAATSDSLRRYPNLPVCRAVGENRVPVPIWNPRVTPTPTTDIVSTEPPTGDGRIVYISVTPSPQYCGEDPLSLNWPNDPKNPDFGGIEVKLRGNAHAETGRCVLAGFYMNEMAFGVLQGWVSGNFGAVDEKRVIASGTYCLAKPSASARQTRR
jgi:hypothetical protein